MSDKTKCSIIFIEHPECNKLNLNDFLNHNSHHLITVMNLIKEYLKDKEQIIFI